VGDAFTPFFLLFHPTSAPDRLSAAVVHPELVKTAQLYLKAPGDPALLAYSVVLFPFLRLVLSHTLFPMLARRWGIRKAGKVARFGEQGYAVVYFAVVGAWGGELLVS
jgi:acyl-CoA-dependent ceramide synthase